MRAAVLVLAASLTVTASPAGDEGERPKRGSGRL